MGINTAILRTSRALHKEAEAFLYQLHEFDFHNDVFGVIPFLQSLSHHARHNISCITMYLTHADVLRVGDLLYLTRPNIFEWGLACSYIAQNARLREFAFHLQSGAPEGFQNLSWVQDTAQIKGLRKLTYYECKDYRCEDRLDHLRTEDGDRLTTGISDRNQALLTYLRSQMLDAPTTHC